MICLRYLQQREDALDVLQNALIKIYTKIDMYNAQRGAFKAWSGRIVVNECIMFLRKKVIHMDGSEMFLEEMTSDSEADAISMLTSEELTQIIQRLPDGYRLVFNMYVIEGFQHKEIAQTLGIDVGTSKSQLFKAKRILRKEIEKSFSVPDQTVITTG